MTKVKLTHHAKERAEQFGFSVDEVYWMFYHSDKEPTPPNAKKYSNSGLMTYRRNGTVVMTARKTIDKYTGEEIYLLITLFDQRMYLPVKKLVAIY